MRFFFRLNLNYRGSCSWNGLGFGLVSRLGWLGGLARLELGCGSWGRLGLVTLKYGLELVLDEDLGTVLHLSTSVLLALSEGIEGQFGLFLERLLYFGVLSGPELLRHDGPVRGEGLLALSQVGCV